MIRNFELARNVEADDLLETLLVSAISSIFLIRFFLYITGYWQLGGGIFHIAHVLWGGIFMLVGLVILLTFLGKRVRVLGAVIGGVGFGFFIDELGKFITKDNNYFYEPTVSLLYLLFLILFFIFRSFSKRQLSRKEYLMNALSFLEDVINNDMDSEEQEKFNQFIKHADTTHHLTKTLKSISNQIELVEKREPSKLNKLYQSLSAKYEQTLRSDLFLKLVLVAVVIKGVHGLLSLMLILFGSFDPQRLFLFISLTKSEFASIGFLISTSISILLVIVGIIGYRFSRIQSYRLFKYSVLVSILVTQFFSFYIDQFSAVFNLIFNLLLLFGLNELISRNSVKGAVENETIELGKMLHLSTEK